MSWSVSPEAVSGILTATQTCYDDMATQLYGTGETGAPAGSGPVSWDGDVEAMGSSDVAVGNALVKFIDDQLGEAGAGLSGVGAVVRATFDAAQSLVLGDESMAGQVVADYQAAPDSYTGVR